MTAMDNARSCWGDALPDWIEALADACDKESQARIARRLGYSGAVVSQVLRARYRGAMSAVETAVRGALLAAEVDCPVVGSLPSDVCLVNQRAPWAPHNPRRIAFYKACRSGCPHSRLGGPNAQ